MIFSVGLDRFLTAVAVSPTLRTADRAVSPHHIKVRILSPRQVGYAALFVTSPCRASASRSRSRRGGGGGLFAKVTGLNTHKRMFATNVGGRDPRGFCRRLLAGIETVEAADLKSPASRSRHRPYQNQRIHRNSPFPWAHNAFALADNSTKPGAVQDRAPFAFGAAADRSQGRAAAWAVHEHGARTYHQSRRWPRERRAA
jgi:hypothetical protein